MGRATIEGSACSLWEGPRVFAAREFKEFKMEKSLEINSKNDHSKIRQDTSAHRFHHRVCVCGGEGGVWCVWCLWNVWHVCGVCVLCVCCVCDGWKWRITLTKP